MSSPSDNSDSNDEPARGANGWVDESRHERPVRDAPRPGPELDLDGPEEQPLARREPDASRRRGSGEQRGDSVVDEGKPMAVLSHMSILFGLPIFLIPLIRRENAFALHHAKSAMVIFLLFIAAFIASFVTCGLAVPLALLLYVPAIVGVVHAARGERAGPWALGHWGEKLLDLQVDVNDSESHPPRQPDETTGEGRQNW